MLQYGTVSLKYAFNIKLYIPEVKLKIWAYIKDMLYMGIANVPELIK